MSAFELPPFYPILDTGILAVREFSVVAAAEAILETGARILQFRHKDFFSRATFEQAQEVAKLCRAAGVRLVMNDRADFAKLLSSALHLGQDDLAPSDARKLLPSPEIIGFSTHNREQLVQGDAEPVDYLAIGPIFATGSKKNPDPVVGGVELAALRAVTKKPLVAIGGITRTTACSVLDAGADSLAIIGDLYPDPLTKLDLRKRAEEWLVIAASRNKKPG
jgi:thiamine-phosphate pyrophosphorylase